jgi:hypothetical protein
MEVYMRLNSLLALLFLVTVSFGIVGGCNNNGSSNNDGDTEEPGAEDPSFNLDTAIELAELSLVAYEQRIQCINDGKGAITVPSGYTLEEVYYDEVTDADSGCHDDEDVVPAAFIVTKGDNIYLSFRGTSNLVDAVSDFAALQEPYMFLPNFGNVSIGFQVAYQGTDDNPIESAILSKLDELTMTGNFSNLYITGHSLGAALAFLAFPDLSNNVGMLDSVTMYNFAGPAAGDSDFVTAYEEVESQNRISVRVVNTNDLVPKLPPLGLDCENFSYFHTNDKHEITFGTELPALPDFAKDDCDFSTIGTDLLTYGINNLNAIEEDHSMCTYYKTLCNMSSDPSSCAAGAIGCDNGDANP